MKVSEYILQYLKDLGVRHAFLVTGGFISPIVNAFDENINLKYVCTTQEQGAAMAAEAYSRISENLGVAISTSGPGATNLVTGIACAYFDSIPVLFLTGQVSTNESLEKDGPRQIGFQETDVVGMVKPITKFAVRVEKAQDIKYYLDQAVYIAKLKRPGPVLIDLPMDVQLAEINPKDLKSFVAPTEPTDYKLLDDKINQVIELINQALRPVIILGAGVKIAKARKEVRELIEKLGLPVAVSWGAIDILPHNHPLFIEGFGVSANRVGNFAVQNADLILSIGSRLDTRQTGTKRQTFARQAKKIVVDIDQKELYKGRGMAIDVGIEFDIKDFLAAVNKKIGKIKVKDISGWLEKIASWKARYPICRPEYYQQAEKVNPYVFMDVLSKACQPADIIVADTGNTLSWTMQAFKVKQDQRLFSDLGHSSMGYSLPAAIGACFAADQKPVINIEGDGAFKMNINELETIARHNLPVKTFILNNHGYGMIRQFQDVWFNSCYKASCAAGGLGDADLLKVAQAYGLKIVRINSRQELKDKIKEVLDYNGPVVCSVEINENEKAIPKLEFGMPIEDTAPLLSLAEFKENMIVKPLPESIEKRKDI